MERFRCDNDTRRRRPPGRRERRRFSARAALIASIAAGVFAAGLGLATAASNATTTIQVSALNVLLGSATGTVSGFEPNATVTINGSVFVADATGTVTLVNASLAGQSTLTISFSDSSGTGQSLTTPLTSAATGLVLTVAELLDPTLDTTAPITLVIEGGAGTTSGGTTTSGGSGGTTTTSGGTTTTGTGGSGGATVPGAQPLSGGGFSIPSSSVLMPKRLVIKRVVFSPRLVRSRNKLITIRYRIGDTRGLWVRNAAVWMRGVPLNRITSVREKRTSNSGWVTFTVRSTRHLKLQPGGRLTIFVRARKPGEPLLGGSSTRRLVSLGVSAPR